MKPTARLLIVATALAAAGVARAEVAPTAPDILTAHLAASARPAPAPSKALDLSSRQAGFDVLYAHAGPARIPGVARTSVDRKLASDDLTGSLGFLCGLEPGAGKQGVAAARGYDPSGRFVGAKLRLAFR